MQTKLNLAINVFLSNSSTRKFLHKIFVETHTFQLIKIHLICTSHFDYFIDNKDLYFFGYSKILSIIKMLLLCMYYNIEMNDLIVINIILLIIKWNISLKNCYIYILAVGYFLKCIFSQMIISQTDIFPNVSFPK